MYHDVCVAVSCVGPAVEYADVLWVGRCSRGMGPSITQVVSWGWTKTTRGILINLETMQSREIMCLVCLSVCLSRPQGCCWLIGVSKLPLIAYYLVLLATAGLLATLCVQCGVVGLPSQQKTQTLPDKKSVCSVWNPFLFIFLYLWEWGRIVRLATSGIVRHPLSG